MSVRPTEANPLLSRESIHTRLSCRLVLPLIYTAAFHALPVMGQSQAESCQSNVMIHYEPHLGTLDSMVRTIAMRAACLFRVGLHASMSGCVCLSLGEHRSVLNTVNSRI
jgi:hypothetical protein